MRIMFSIVALLGSFTPATAAQYDIVVIGATPAGIAAAMTAGREGKKVMLVEQAPVPGGMLSSGVSFADDSILAANSGIFDEFRRRVAQYHRATLADDPVMKEHLTKPRMRWNLAEGQGWEPKTAARIYREMLAEIPAITTRFNEVPVGAVVKGDRLVAVLTQQRDRSGRLGSKHRYEGRVIIDATYEGDVAAHARVPFRIGREARSREEPHAGHIFTDFGCDGINALSGTIFPGGTGRGDDLLQAFAFRFTAKDYATADHPQRLHAAPPGYDPAQFKWSHHHPLRLPNGKIDMLAMNWGGDLAGLSAHYVLAGWEERTRIEEVFRNHSLGWLYYVQTDGGAPQLGLASDEFIDNGNFPYRLYVREGRRIEGLYTLTESDIHKDLRGNGMRGPLHRDSVAIGLYEMDSHNVHSPTDRNSPCAGEGAFMLSDISGPYQIPYGVMVPKARKGLLVPVAISSTHVAISAVRMEPIWSSLGQAAGVAAVLALESGRELEEISVTRIQDALLRQGSILFFYKDLSSDAAEFAAVQRLSLLGAVDSDENYHFLAAQPVTMAELARLAVIGLDIPLSITAAHFKDVPRGHPAFKFIETLYDHSTQSAQPFFPFEVRDYQNYQSWWSVLRSPRYAPAFAYPDRAVSVESAVRILSGLLGRTVPMPTDPTRMLSRGEAALLIDQLRRDADPNQQS